MDFVFTRPENPSSGPSPWESASDELFQHLTDPRPRQAPQAGRGQEEAPPPAPDSSTNRAWNRMAQGEGGRAQSVSAQNALPSTHSFGLRTQEDLSGVSEPLQTAQSERQVRAGGAASARHRRAMRSGRGGRNCFWVNGCAPRRRRTASTPKTRGPMASGREMASWSRRGTSLRVAGAVLSDGALLCHWPQLGQPGTDVRYRPVWLHHYEVELAISASRTTASQRTSSRRWFPESCGVSARPCSRIWVLAK